MRIYDGTVVGLTGAQWMSLALVPVGIWVLAWVRPRLARAGARHQGMEDADEALTATGSAGG